MGISFQQAPLFWVFSPLFKDKKGLSPYKRKSGVKNSVGTASYNL
jgi:hypothetical protein